MVGLGLLMILVGLVGLILRWYGSLYEKRWFLRLAVLMGPSGFVAVLAGWVTTEVGRQPYLVYGLMRTVEGRSPIDSPAVAGSLIAFIAVYVLVFGAGVYYLLRLMGGAPGKAGTGPEPGVPQRAAGITPSQALEQPR
jgi:cytochrome d ubiquinol oxidase subunit I